MTREEALNRVKGYLTDIIPIEGYSEVEEIVKALDQEPKIGHWILTDDDVFVYCSECEDSYYPRPIDASWHYCPNCGAKMVNPQESEVE